MEPANRSQENKRRILKALPATRKDLIELLNLPSSTVDRWLKRLISENCAHISEKPIAEGRRFYYYSPGPKLKKTKIEPAKTVNERSRERNLRQSRRNVLKSNPLFNIWSI